VAELATVRIHRPVHRIGASAAIVVELDGVEVGRLRNGQNLVTYVESGRHNARARMMGTRSAPVELELAPGQDVQLEMRWDTGPWSNRLVLVRTKENVPESPPEVLGTTEMHRSEEPIGTEERRINNTSGAARLTRTMRVTREWSRTISLHHETTHDDSTETTVGPDWLRFQAGIKRHLTLLYEVNKNHREEFAEEFCVEVGPGAEVTVVLAWKRLWQHGVAHALYQGRPIDIPFRVAVGVTFDQSLV
jgi:hypothetical protein